MSPLDLSAASADRRETLPRDAKLSALYNACPKIQEARTKNGPKTCKICGDFILYNLRLWSRISPEGLNISKIEKTHGRQRFLPRSKNKSPVNFGLLTIESRTCEFGPTQTDNGHFRETTGLPQNLGGHRPLKRPTFFAIADDNFRLWSRMSTEWINMSKIRIVVDHL